jgi:3-methyladenine DNA glycosylase AlkD
MDKFKELENPEAVSGMARFGIKPEKNFGLSVSMMRKIARGIRKDHALAQKLWLTGIREARMVACLIDDPNKVTDKQMEKWVSDFDTWEICDHCCGNLFDRTDLAVQKVFEWSSRSEEFVKRAAFALIAWLAVHDKKADDDEFLKFLPIIIKESNDDRNYVKKGVNWALRHIGKRNIQLNKQALKTAKEIQKLDTRSARWIANDAIRELTSEKIQERLKKKKTK